MPTLLHTREHDKIQFYPIPYPLGKSGFRREIGLANTSRGTAFTGPLTLSGVNS